MAMTCDFCLSAVGVVRFTSDTAVAVDICKACLDEPASSRVARPPADDGETIRFLTVESERATEERKKKTSVPEMTDAAREARRSLLRRGAEPVAHVPDVQPTSPEIAMEDKIFAAVQKALAVAGLPTFPPAPVPAPTKADAILPEDAEEDFMARRDALDFDLEAAQAVETAAETPDKNKLAVLEHCRSKLAAAAFDNELETIRKYAAQRGLLAAGAELGFRIPAPKPETDAERQARQRQFEAETAPQPGGTEVREGNGRPVLSAWGSAIDPRVIGQ